MLQRCASVVYPMLVILLQVRFGKLTEDAIDTLRLLRDAFGVVFKIREDTESQTMILSCLGVGYQNVARRAT